MSGYKLTDSMRNLFYNEREQLRSKIKMIKEYLSLNDEFLLQSKKQYNDRLESCKNSYELFLAEDETPSNLVDFEQIYLNGCLMYLISQYEYYIKRIYREVCVITHTSVKVFYRDITNSHIEEIKNVLNINFHKSTTSTFSVIASIVKLRNQLTHTNGQSYNFDDIVKKHFTKHSNQLKIFVQCDGRIDVNLTPTYILYVCNIIESSFFSLTKLVYKKFKKRKL